METFCQVSRRKQTNIKKIVQYKISLSCDFIFSSQLIRDIAVAFLGQFRYGRPDVLRSNRNQKLHQILGAAHVRILLGHQHYRPAEHAYRHDVQLLSNNFGTIINSFGFLCKHNRKIVSKI